MTTKALVQIEHPQRQEPGKSILDVSFSGNDAEPLNMEWVQIRHAHLDPYVKLALNDQFKVLEAQVRYQNALNEELRINPVKRWVQELFFSNAYVERRDDMYSANHDVMWFTHQRGDAVDRLVKAELNLVSKLTQFLLEKGFALTDTEIDKSGLITQEWVKSSTERSVP